MWTIPLMSRYDCYPDFTDEKSRHREVPFITRLQSEGTWTEIQGTEIRNDCKLDAVAPTITTAFQEGRREKQSDRSLT